jgi:replication-associated recombination protein RarA
VKPYFGHEKNLKAVKNHLPSVLLFEGPASVGKWELAEYIREKWGFKNSDTLRIKRLTQENARFAAKFANERPRGWSKLVIVRLNRKATKGAQNILLKSMEEARDATFILITEEAPLETVRSRAIPYKFGLLSEEDVYKILTIRLRYSEERAETMAKLSGGQIKRALSHKRDQESKLVVMKALDAVHRRDAEALESLVKLWQQEHTDLLVQWCYEALTGRWKLFVPEESSITGKKVPMRILVALSEDLRPRLVVRSALSSVLQGA